MPKNLECLFTVSTYKMIHRDKSIHTYINTMLEYLDFYLF